MQYLNPFIYLFIWLETYASRFSFCFLPFYCCLCKQCEPRAYGWRICVPSCGHKASAREYDFHWKPECTALHSILHKSENHGREREREGNATQSANNKIQWILRRTLNMNTLFYVRRVKYLYGILWTRANERNGRIGWTKRQHGRSLEIDLLASSLLFHMRRRRRHFSLSTLALHVLIYIFHISFMHRSQSPLHACTRTNGPYISLVSIRITYL